MIASDSQSAGARDRLSAAIPIAIAILAVAVRIVLLRVTHCTIEDAYITLRYADNIAHGQGFVYNHGERVLGTTTPLFTLILAFFTWLGMDGLAVGKAICIFADGAVCYLIARLLWTLGYKRAAWLGALLYATASAPINFSIGGMETALVTLAGLGAVYTYVLKRPTAMAMCLGALFLLRIDGLLLAASLIVGWLLIYKSFPLRSITAGVMLTLPWIAFAIAYFGSAIPTSAIAKLIVYQHVVAERFPNRRILIHQFVGDPIHAALFVVSVIGGVSLWRARKEMRAPIDWFMLYHLAILASRAPVEAFGWYFVPPFPVYCVLTAAGASLLWQQLKRIMMPGTDRPFASNRLVDYGLALTALFLVVNLRSTARHISFAQEREDSLRKYAGEWMGQNVPPGSKVMMEAIGYVGYFSRLPVLDMVGLVSPEVIPIYQTQKYPLGEIVIRFKPAYLLLRVSERETLEDYTRATARTIVDSDYEYIRGFPGEGDRAYLVLYRRRTQ